MALQEASEAYLIGLFEDSNLCTIQAKPLHNNAKGYPTSLAYLGWMCIKKKKKLSLKHDLWR